MEEKPSLVLHSIIHLSLDVGIDSLGHSSTKKKKEINKNKIKLLKKDR